MEEKFYGLFDTEISEGKIFIPEKWRKTLKNGIYWELIKENGELVLRCAAENFSDSMENAEIKSDGCWEVPELFADYVGTKSVVFLGCMDYFELMTEEYCRGETDKMFIEDFPDIETMGENPEEWVF